MNLAPWQYTVWMGSLLLVALASGCAIGLTAGRKQKVKASNARKR